MTFEQLVGEALHSVDDFEPSADLFAKVQLSIDEDTAHRARVRRGLAWLAAAIVAAAVYLAVTVEVADGSASMSFRALEIFVTLLMVAVVLVVGPAIRRFGEQFEREAFRGSPETGTRVLKLLDIAYYLVFLAFIMMTLVYDPTLAYDGNLAAWVNGELDRVAGLLLVMGLLHVGLLLALPVAGLVHSANEWRVRIADGLVSTDSAAARVDRVVTVTAWVVAALVALQLVFVVGNVLLFLGTS